MIVQNVLTTGDAQCQNVEIDAGIDHARPNTTAIKIMVSANPKYYDLK